MVVDRNLFLHDLAIVAIMKNEAPYLKEWLDYHLLAGVDHFYIYDNDSPDNQAEVAKPYVEAGLVDYIPAPGKAMQMLVYNDAVKRFKFQCRYMAIIDGDEFIFPQSNRSISEVIDEILSQDLNAGGVEISWQCFGSNGQEEADYSRGVLERFTRRAFNDLKSSSFCKTIFNARKVNYTYSPHFVIYFEGFYAVNSNNELQKEAGRICPPLTEKIVVNHYHCKSWEEYQIKNQRGYAADLMSKEHYTRKQFERNDRNDEFDDGIINYYDERTKNFQLPYKSHADKKLINALAENLSPVFLPTTPPDFYVGKMETFLTCRAVSSYIRTKFKDEPSTKFFEEASLVAILRSLANGTSLADVGLFLSELPNLLSLPYPVVEELRVACLNIIQQLMNFMRLNNVWKDFVE